MPLCFDHNTNQAKLLCSDDLVVDNELDVLYLVVAWAHHQAQPELQRLEAEREHLTYNVLQDADDVATISPAAAVPYNWQLKASLLAFLQRFSSLLFSSLLFSSLLIPPRSGNFGILMDCHKRRSKWYCNYNFIMTFISFTDTYTLSFHQHFLQMAKKTTNPVVVTLFLFLSTTWMCRKQKYQNGCWGIYLPS